MCLIGQDKEIKILLESESVIGFKIWRKLKDQDLLVSTASYFQWIPGKIKGDIKNPERGIFSWSSHYYYNYNYYNCNYYYNYYNYNYNYYNIFGEIYQYGETHFHDFGYRSEFAKPKLFLNLNHQKDRNINFVDRFNKTIDNLSKLYNVPVESFDDYILRK